MSETWPTRSTRTFSLASRSSSACLSWSHLRPTSTWQWCLAMALALDSGPAFHESRELEYAEIERWYRDLLDTTLPPSDLRWEPVRIGPTWQWVDGWLLPEASLGWGFLSWTGYWLNGKGGKPWRWTPEQVRFL